MRRFTGWVPCLVTIVAGCSGKTVTVLETSDAPANGGASAGSQGQGCLAPEECGLGLVCHPDGQCHTMPLHCGVASCGTTNAGECACAWSCEDASEYETRCRLTSEGLVTCNCGVAGVEFPWTCVVEEPTTDVCGMGKVCCAFPLGLDSPWSG